MHSPTPPLDAALQAARRASVTLSAHAAARSCVVAIGLVCTCDYFSEVLASPKMFV